MLKINYKKYKYNEKISSLGLRFFLLHIKFNNEINFIMERKIKWKKLIFQKTINL